MPARRSSMHQPPARRGRAALAWGLASFLVLQLGLAGAIERWLPQLRDPAYALKARLLGKRTVQASERPLTVVMVGSSRVESGLLGQPLEEQLTKQLGRRPVVFNFGISGAAGVTELLTVRRLLADGIRPDVVLIEVLAPTLAAQVPSYDVSRLTSERLWLGDLDLVARFGPALAALKADWWQAWPVPWYSHRYAILAQLAPVFLPGRVPWGGRNQFDLSGVGQAMDAPRTPDIRRRAVEQALSSYAPCFQEFHLGGPSQEALRELLELCRQQRIATALVLMPEGKVFRDLYPPEAWQQIQAYLTGLSREYNAPLINAREWIADEQFADSHHLLRPGAAQFTERLGRDHLGPLLAGDRSACR